MDIQRRTVFEEVLLKRGENVEFLVFLVIAALLVRLIKSYFGVPKHKELLVLSGDAGKFRSGSKTASYQWLKPGQSFICRGYSVEDGMVYVGERMRDFTGANEGCLINPELEVAPEGTPSLPVKEIQPRYETMNPEQRGAYLGWLGEGRSGRADPAWPFLFLYGIERRLFVDGQRGYVAQQERNELVSEVCRLLDVYGEHRSFRGYCKKLLATEWVLKGDYAEIPEWVDFTDRFCAEPYNAIISLYVSVGRPIPDKVALQWLFLHPELIPGTLSRREPEKFTNLFLAGYKEKFGDGILIHKNHSPLNLIYKGANPSLGNGVKLFVQALPDPFLLATPIKKLTALAEECITAMESDETIELKGRVFNADDIDLLESLDDVHSEFMARLATKTLWPRSDVLALCTALSITPEPSFELLNAWGCIAGGLPLIDDGDPVFVDIPLLQEMLLRENADAQ